MNKLIISLSFSLIALFAIPLSAQTDIQKRFLLRQYQIGMDQALPPFRKYQLWSVTKSGTPVVMQNWTLKIVKPAIDPSTQKAIDFGPNKNRYVKFEIIYNNGKYPVSISSYVGPKPGTNLAIQMNLYEEDGKFVKTLSRYGTFVGSSESNFVYEAEGKYPILVTYETVIAGQNHTYEVQEKQLEHMLAYSIYDNHYDLSADYEIASEKTLQFIENNYTKWNDRKKSAYTPVVLSDKPQIAKAQAELKASCPLFSLQFTREYCAATYHESKDNVNIINGFLPMGDSFSGNILDWGTNGDRYLKFEPEWVLRRSGSNAALKDDIYGTNQAVVIVLCLYEKDGTFVKRVANGGGCMLWSPGHIFYNGENKNGFLFRTEKIKLSSSYLPNIYSYKATMSRFPANNLSDITKFGSYDSFR